MSSRTQALMDAVKQMPIARQLVPMEAGVGWPIPQRKDNGVYMKLPFYGLRPDPNGGADLYAPVSMITLDWRTGRPVAFVDFSYDRPWDFEAPRDRPIGRFPHAAVRGTRGDYLRGRDELLAMYDEMFEHLTARKTFESRWIDRFGELLRSYLEPALEPYYRSLGPRFLEQFLTPASGVR